MVTRKTSKTVYDQIKNNGLLSKLRWKVYDYVYNNGPCTAKDVTSALLEGDQSSGVYNTRLSELSRMGTIKEIGITKCQRTGRKVILWDVTDKLPTKPETVKATGKTRKQLEAEIQDLREKLHKAKEKIQRLNTTLTQFTG